MFVEKVVEKLEALEVYVECGTLWVVEKDVENVYGSTSGYSVCGKIGGKRIMLNPVEPYFLSKGG